MKVHQYQTPFFDKINCSQQRGRITNWSTLISQRKTVFKSHFTGQSKVPANDALDGMGFQSSRILFHESGRNTKVEDNIHADFLPLMLLTKKKQNDSYRS